MLHTHTCYTHMHLMVPYLCSPLIQREVCFLSILWRFTSRMCTRCVLLKQGLVLRGRSWQAETCMWSPQHLPSLPERCQTPQPPCSRQKITSMLAYCQTRLPPAAMESKGWPEAYCHIVKCVFPLQQWKARVGQMHAAISSNALLPAADDVKQGLAKNMMHGSLLKLLPGCSCFWFGSRAWMMSVQRHER
jgi:hypothetical protein